MSNLHSSHPRRVHLLKLWQKQPMSCSKLRMVSAPSPLGNYSVSLPSTVNGRGRVGCYRINQHRVSKDCLSKTKHFKTSKKIKPWIEMIVRLVHFLDYRRAQKGPMGRKKWPSRSTLSSSRMAPYCRRQSSSFARSCLRRSKPFATLALCGLHKVSIWRVQKISTTCVTGIEAWALLTAWPTTLIPKSQWRPTIRLQ